MSKRSVYNEALSELDEVSVDGWYIRLGFMLHDAARLRRIILDEKLKPLEITRSQAWLMAYVSRCNGQTQSQLAEQMSLGNVAVGGLIDRLEKTAMIERRAEPSDRRVRRIYLTVKGKKVLSLIREITIEANEEILADISVDEVIQATQTLEKLKKNIEAML